MLTFRDVSKFASVNPATEALISDGFVIDAKIRRQSICDEPKHCIEPFQQFHKTIIVALILIYYKQ